MMKGRSAGVPDFDYWDLYRDALKRVPGLVGYLTDEIKAYVTTLCDELPAHKFEINSSKACTLILKRSPHSKKWKAEFGKDHRKLFGMVLFVVLSEDPDHLWDGEDVPHHGYSQRVYTIVDGSERRPGPAHVFRG